MTLERHDSFLHNCERYRSITLAGQGGSRKFVRRVSSSRPVGRPKDHDKARAILDAGWQLFLAHGVEATSIEAIAARAGVSKVTLYKYYPDRTTLFKAAVLREMERIEQAQGVHQPTAVQPIAAQLRAFGLGIMTFLTSQPAIDFYSVVAGELRRHETLARAFYDLGPGRTRANLAGLLGAAVARGELAALDPHQAAEELFGLWQGFTNFQFSLGIDIALVHADLERRVTRGVQIFLAIYELSPV